MSVLSSVKRILFLVTIIPVVAFGQAALRGTITDATNNETLIGVNVVVIGTSLGAATDIEGQYRIVGIPESVHSIKVSCIGYEAQTIEIDFSGGKDIQKNIAMKLAILQGEEVVVTAQMRGQIAAINQQLTSKTIVNVVSEEKIKELPDANAAEAIGRLPGVSLIRSGGEATNVVMRGLSSKFSNITVDGVKIPPTDPNTRDVDLSMLSQGSLAGIELYKTLTPDQDADAIAGSINLVTKKAPSERLIQFDVKGNYNDLMKLAQQYDISARYGERFFDNMIGLQLQANVERKNRSSEEGHTRYYAFEPVNGYNTDYWINQLLLNFTEQIRKRQGGQIIIDVNTPDSGSVKLTGAYSSTTNDIGDHNRTYALNTNGGTWDWSYRYQEFELSTVNASLQGKNHVFGLNVDWNFSFAQSMNKNPYDFYIDFMSSSEGGSSIPSGKTRPEDLAKYALNNYAAAQCSTGIFRKQENIDNERTAYINLSKEYTIGSLLSGEVKGGAKYKNRSRWMSQTLLGDNSQLHSVYLDGVDTVALKQSHFSGWYSRRGVFLLSDFIGGAGDKRKLLGKYTMSPILNMDIIRQYYALLKDGSGGATKAFNSSALASINGYITEEELYSAFLMNTLNIGQSMTLITGLRVEQENNDYLARYGTDLSVIGIVVYGTPKDSLTHFKETIWLPNVQFVIKPTDYLTVRLAGYRALARPDYNMRLPRFSTSNGSPTPFTLGNPNLKSAKAWNFEVNTQIYNNTIGLISISAFYKKIDDLFHQMTNVPIGNIRENNQILTSYNDSILASVGITIQRNPAFKSIFDNNANASYTLPYNSPGPSYVWGLELEHQTNFGFISPSLSNITLSYNISITRSETEILTSYPYIPFYLVFRGGRWVWEPGSVYNLAKIETRQSENQPEIYGNCSLGYDIDGFSARLSVFYQDEYVQSYSASNTANIVNNSFTKWDLSLKQKISPVVTVFFNIENLTNVIETTSYVNKVQGWSLQYDELSYGRSAELGIRLTL